MTLPARSTTSARRRLDETEIVATLTRLSGRISERFPGSGLAEVGAEALVIAGEVRECAAYLRRPNLLLRTAVGVAIVGMFALLAVLAATIHVPTRVVGMADFAQGIDAGINDVIFLAVAVFFLVTIEGRLKRRRALTALHELRSLVHIVDMHQLTKDPERLLSSEPKTASSPERTMSPGELGRYLDYCSELLSLASKVAALLAQYQLDPVVLAAVDEIEMLAAGFSSKIWQKITLIDRGLDSRR